MSTVHILCVCASALALQSPRVRFCKVLVWCGLLAKENLCPFLRNTLRHIIPYTAWNTALLKGRNDDKPVLQRCVISDWSSNQRVIIPASRWADDAHRWQMIFSPVWARFTGICQAIHNQIYETLWYLFLFSFEISYADGSTLQSLHALPRLGRLIGWLAGCRPPAPWLPRCEGQWCRQLLDAFHCCPLLSIISPVDELHDLGWPGVPLAPRAPHCEAPNVHRLEPFRELR